MTDYIELRRLAEAAPSGPWLAENDSLYFKDDGYTRHLLDADAGHDVEDEDYHAALSYIAAASPDTLLELLETNKQMLGFLAEISQSSGDNWAVMVSRSLLKEFGT